MIFLDERRRRRWQLACMGAALGKKLETMRRRQLLLDDGSSPFARKPFSLLPPEEQERIVAKRRTQKLAAEALDAQLADRAASSPQRRSSPPVLREPAHAQPQPRSDSRPTLDGRVEAQRSPQRVRGAADPRGQPQDDDAATPAVAWWHEPEARRGSPPPRRRSGRELLRDPEESLLREAERLKKLEVGEALRAQMQEREQRRAGSPAARQAASGRDGVEAAAEAVASDARSEEAIPTDRLSPGPLGPLRCHSAEAEPAHSTEMAISAATPWQEHPALHDRLARLEYQLGWVQADRKPPDSYVDLDTLASELRKEMRVIHDAHATLNADLDEQVEFMAHLDQSVKALQVQIPPDLDSDAPSTHATQAMGSLRHDVDQLLAERSKTKREETDLDVRLASVVEQLRHEFGSEASRTSSTQVNQRAEELSVDRDAAAPARDPSVAELSEQLNRVQGKQFGDHMLLVEQIAALESMLAQQVEALHASLGCGCICDDLRHDVDQLLAERTQTKHEETELDIRLASVVNELRQEIERRAELSAAALDQISKTLSESTSAAGGTAAVHEQSLQAKMSRELSAFSGRVEVLERMREDAPSLAELSEKVNGVEEKQFDDHLLLEEQVAALEVRMAAVAADNPEGALQALQGSVQSCREETASVASKLQSMMSITSEQVSAVSHRVEVLERGREGDLQQLSEKLNGVEEKQFDEQVLLEEQIAALESQLAVTVTGGGGRDVSR